MLETLEEACVLEDGHAENIKIDTKNLLEWLTEVVAGRTDVSVSEVDSEASYGHGMFHHPLLQTSIFL